MAFKNPNLKLKDIISYSYKVYRTSICVYLSQNDLKPHLVPWTRTPASSRITESSSLTIELMKLGNLK